MSKTKIKLNNIWQSVKNGNTVMVVSLVFLLMIMLVSTNHANSQSLETNDLRQQIKVAEDQLRLSNTSASELQNTERIEQESQRLNLVKTQTQDIYYLDGKRDLLTLR